MVNRIVVEPWFNITIVVRAAINRRLYKSVRISYVSCCTACSCKIAISLAECMNAENAREKNAGVKISKRDCSGGKCFPLFLFTTFFIPAFSILLIFRCYSFNNF